MEKSDQDSGSNRNHLARQSEMDSSDGSEMKHSHSVIDSQEGSPSQPQTPSCSPVKSSSQRSAAEVSTQVVTPPQKPRVHHRFNSNQEPLTPRGETKAESNYDGTPSKQRRCSCKASRCLKLYCECFALGSYCNGCNCLTCHNTLEKETSRQEAIKAILERNPDAFKPKIAGSPHGLNDKHVSSCPQKCFTEDLSQLVTLGKHNRGCNCKRSGCLKKYCECYQANIRCSENCRCRGCKNFEGSEEIQQTTQLPELRKRNSASHSVAARGSSAAPHLVQNQTVDYVVRNGDTSLFTVPNNRAVSGSTTSTYRSSPSDTRQLGHVKELFSLLVSKSVDVANRQIQTTQLPELRKRNSASHSVAARASSASPHLVQNQTVDYVVKNGDTSLFTAPNNRAVSRSTTSTYRSSPSDTIQLSHVKELCSLLVSKSVEVANKMSGTDKERKDEKDSSLDPAQRDVNEINDSPDCVLDANKKIDEKPMSPATRALMCDEGLVNISEKEETSARVKTNQEKDTRSEVYAEQEKQILSCFRDHLFQLFNRGSINGRNIQKANTDPSRKEPENEEQSHRDPSLGA